MLRFIIAIFALLCSALTAPLTAQTVNSDATASVVIAANLTVTNTRGMNFGTVFSSAGIVRTTNANSAEWTANIDPGNTVSLTFSLPASLARVGGGGNGPVPFSCNTISGGFIFGGDAGDREFNPYVGSGPYLVGGGNNFLFSLGRENSVPNYGCALDVTGRTSGTYSGIITATVTVL